MNNYELICIFKADLTNQSITQLSENISKNINNVGGKIVAEESWGIRNLSYSIKNQKKGYYYFLQISIIGNELSKFRNFLNLEEKIIRHLFVKVPQHEKLPTVMMKEINSKEYNEK